jgi:DUF3011 family protein
VFPRRHRQRCCALLGFMRVQIGVSFLRAVMCAIAAAGALTVHPARAIAQDAQAAGTSATSIGLGTVATQNRIICQSRAGERQQCPADTSAGVALITSRGESSCLLGKTWGYDDNGVWVAGGCSGEFQLGQVTQTGAQAAATGQAAATPNDPTKLRFESWGEFDPGDGFLVGRNSKGELAISAFALMRYANQMPAEQTFTDHLGHTRTVDGRNDIWPHRVMVFFKGWLGDPKLIYVLTFWTVLDTNQNAIFGNLGYQFSRKFSVYAGLNGNPGTRSLQGSHPFWLGNDRVMADEFFRPFFTSGVWVQGEAVPGFWYNVMLGDNSSILGVTSAQLDRKFTYGGSAWWMPTTKEFGPKGAYGDWEYHEKVATRFGVSSTWSPEQRFTDTTGSPDNTNLKLADSVNVFDTGALAPGITVDTVDYKILSLDAGMKYKGLFLQTEVYNRWLEHFKADGALPLSNIHDKGFYVQGGFFPIKQKLELYSATSQIFGDKGAGFSNSSEYLAGMNFYFTATRYHRLNLQVIDVNHSPVSSAFGYYVGGLKGTVVATTLSVYF